MVKVIVCARRKQGISREEFARYYEEQHEPLVIKFFPTLRKYVRNHVVSLLHPPEAEEFDCFTELWFDDMKGFEEFSALYLSDEGQVIRDDEDEFQDRDRNVNFIVDEQVSIIN